MQGRTAVRGSRTVIPPDSGIVHNGANDGAPGDDGARSKPDGDEDQNSKTEHPGDDSSHSPYDHSDADSAEWKELLEDNKRLRKSKEHADRKITQQGQDNARLRRQLSNGNNDGGEDSQAIRSDQIQSVVEETVKRMFGNNLDNQSDDDFDLQESLQEYGIEDLDLGDKKENPNIAKLENVLLGMFSDLKSVQQEVATSKADRAYQEQLTNIQVELGVTEEAAIAMMDLAGDGADVVKLVKAAELTSMPREAREMARESRRANRASIGLPMAGANQFAGGDEDSMKVELKEISEMPDGQSKRDRLFKFLEDYPEGTEALRQMTGIGN